jgi:hypothetical protein
MSVVRGQRAEVRGQNSEGSGRWSVVGGQGSGVRDGLNDLRSHTAAKSQSGTDNGCPGQLPIVQNDLRRSGNRRLYSGYVFDKHRCKYLLKFRTRYFEKSRIRHRVKRNFSGKN